METLHSFILRVLDNKSDTELHKSACKPAIEQMMWVRDKASLLLPLDNDAERYWDIWKVCGFHNSKGVKLPVYYYDSPTLLLVMRNNFYDWNVSVKANKSILIPSYMDVLEAGCCEGMENYKFSSYQGSKYKFSFMSPFNEHLWAILWCITTQTKQ